MQSLNQAWAYNGLNWGGTAYKAAVPKWPTRPQDRKIRRAERALEAQLLALWGVQGQRIVDWLDSGKHPATLTADERLWEQLANELVQLLTPWLDYLVRLGVQVGFSTVFGKLLKLAGFDYATDWLAKQTAPTPHSININWDKVNEDASDWAKMYSYELVRGINATTAKRLGSTISHWIQRGGTTPELIAEVRKIFNNPYRARLIAVTEATRVFAKGNLLTWKMVGFVDGRRWQTAHDDLVCPICRPLHNQEGELDEPFKVTVKGKEYVIDLPPAHPGCRCWHVPVVVIPERDLPPIDALPQEAPAAPMPEELPSELPPEWPRDLSDDSIEYLRNLGGTTGARLVRSRDSGELFVLKRGRDEGHILEEVAADAAYQALGVKVPDFRLYDTSEGKAKLARHIAGDSLADIMRSGDKALIRKVKLQLEAGFVADSLLGNWDVLGLDLDNVIVDNDGEVWRIDNGGALRRRAQGALKSSSQWNEYPVELWTLRDTNVNSVTGRMFEDLGWRKISRLIKDAYKHRDALEAALPLDLRDTVMARLNNARWLERTTLPMNKDAFRESYQDTFAKHLLYLRVTGVTDRLPENLERFGQYKVRDERGVLWDNLRGSGSVLYPLWDYIKEQGGKPGLVSDWMGQQGGSSWSDGSQALKWHITNNMRDPGKVPLDSYYWHNGQDVAEGHYGYAIRSHQVTEQAYADTFAIWHAFNYSLLEQVNFSDHVNRAGRYIEVGRTESNSVIYHTSGLKRGQRGVTMQRGACESGSIFQTVTVAGSELTLQKVPWHRVMGMYFYERTPGSDSHSFYGDGENEIVFIPEGLEFDYFGRVGPREDMDPYWQWFRQG